MKSKSKYNLRYMNNLVFKGRHVNPKVLSYFKALKSHSKRRAGKLRRRAVQAAQALPLKSFKSADTKEDKKAVLFKSTMSTDTEKDQVIQAVFESFFMDKKNQLDYHVHCRMRVKDTLLLGLPEIPLKEMSTNCQGERCFNPWALTSLENVRLTPRQEVRFGMECFQLPLALGPIGDCYPPSAPLFRLLTNLVSFLAHIRMDERGFCYESSFEMARADCPSAPLLDLPILRVDWGNGVITYSSVLDADLCRVNPCGLGMTPYWLTLIRY